MKTVPEEFSPFPDAYVKYVITDLLWSKDYVKFGAKATFLATLNGKNVTFIPQNDTAELISSSDNQTMTTTRKEIPLEKWNMESVDDAKSHLLQGVRITTEFINSLMWFASLTNITRYKSFYFFKKRALLKSRYRKIEEQKKKYVLEIHT